MIRLSSLLVVLLGMCCLEVHAQKIPIGQWQSHLPYNTALSIATDDVNVFVATRHSFYVYNAANEEAIPYSKVNGMSDIGMSKIGYDRLTETVILGYSNSNIDLFSNGSFYNIPHLKQKNVSGTKKINHIYTVDGQAYISTDVGVLVINLDKYEVKETYAFSKSGIDIQIKAVTLHNNMLYAATTDGLYRISRTHPNIQDFQAWQVLDSNRNFETVITSNNKIFAAQPNDVFVIEADTLRSVYNSTDTSITTIVPGVNSLWVLEYNDSTFAGKAKKMNSDYSFSDSFSTSGPAQEIIDTRMADSTKWIASNNNGLLRRTMKGDPYLTVVPDGPGDVASFDISISGKDILVAHGGYDDRYNPLYSPSGFSVYSNDKWKSYKIFNYAPFGDTVFDFVKIMKGPQGEIYAGSSQSGLFILKTDGSYEYYKQNSFIDPSSTGSNLYRISGMTFDNDGVLWLTVYGGTPNELVARTKDGTWYKYSIPASRGIAHAAANIMTDDNNLKWYTIPSGGGVMVFDDNRTPENPLDDSYRQLLVGDGSGGLPNNEVYSLAKDRNGSIWIGTANGIGIVNCPSQVIARKCEAERRIVQFDNFAGLLFQNEQVRTIAVDGANRKWIGTTNGVWLLTPNGDAIIERFTIDNSPLPSNLIQKISINQLTGEVYIGTELGMMTYRGTATEATGREDEKLITFPNPVPSGYAGTIAIKGFMENADVRITDISGQLVFRTTAHGGQAIWNGMDYTGRRPQSGVYLIFGANKDGSQTVKGKMVFME